MKFAEHLGAHITPEWRKQYIQYELMKDMIYSSVEEAPSPEVTDQETIESYFGRFDEMFFQFCDKELLKINTFFSEKLSECSRKYASLTSELDLLEQDRGNVRNRKMSTMRMPLLKSGNKAGAVNARKLHDIKLAFSEFYLSLILLQNYQTLNFTGFRKILKKHDKLLEVDRGGKWRQVNVETAPFYTTKDVDHLIKKTETVFTQRLEQGDRQKAMKRLRVPPLGEKQNPWTTFRVGFFLGIFLVLCSAAILAAFFTRAEHHSDWEAALHMYRAVFLICLHCSLLGINTYGWRSSGVNHVLIFELDPRDHLTHQQLLEIGGFFAVIWALSLLSYLFSHHIGIPVFANPAALVLFCMVFLFNPVKVLNYKARMWFLKLMWRIISAPFHYVGFADFWLADQLNSLSTVLMDFEFMVCFYAMEVDWLPHSRDGVCGKVGYGIRPIVACLPAWWRFAQCLRRYRDTRLVFPHLVNAGKYSTTFLVVLFSSLNSAYKDSHGPDVVQSNAFYYLWIISALISTCYTFTWDIKMDWGLFDKNAGENRFLREEIVYAFKGYYYFAIIEDLVLRFAWTLVVSVGEGGFIHSEVLKSILAPCEVFRRFIWNFLRLENEHINNCGNFRAVRDISIAPIDANDQSLIETMMDEADGVHNRNFGRGSKLAPAPKKSRSMKQWRNESEDDELEPEFTNDPSGKFTSAKKVT